MFQSKKISFDDTLTRIQPDLNQLREELVQYIPCDSKSAQEIIDHFFKSNGKLIRPALFFLCADLCDYDGKHRQGLAAVSELIHSASLLHDDVIDDSKVRRNRPSPHTIWGQSSTILVGDLIYSRASEIVARSNNIRIIDGYASTIRKMSEGELIQLENTFNPEISIENYFKIITYKTAELMAMICKSSALIAELGSEAENALYEYGKNIGISFQLIDDALDYISAQEILGKEVVGDLAEGKLTYPLLAVRERASKKEWLEICSLLTHKPCDVLTLQEGILTYIEKYDAIETTLNLADKHTHLAQDALSIFDDETTKAPLIKLAQTLQIRNY